jgi:hypothetical protein
MERAPPDRIEKDDPLPWSEPGRPHRARSRISSCVLSSDRLRKTSNGFPVVPLVQKRKHAAGSVPRARILPSPAARRSSLVVIGIRARSSSVRIEAGSTPAASKRER